MESPALLLASAPSGAASVKRLVGVPSTKKLYMADGAVWAEIVANAYALQGNAVKVAAPNDGDLLTWVAANSDWEPKPAAGGGGGTGPPYPTLTAPPASGSFTNVQGTATGVTDSLSQLVITAPASSVVWYPFTLASPAAPWTFIGGFRQNGDFADGFTGGLCISDGTKYAYFFCGEAVGIQYNTTVQGFSSTLLNKSGEGVRGGTIFLKIRDDTTGAALRTYHISRDGVNWIQVYSEGRTTNFTATKIGYVVLGGSTAQSGQEMVFHHDVTTP